MYSDYSILYAFVKSTFHLKLCDAFSSPGIRFRALGTRMSDFMASFELPRYNLI